MTGTGSPSVAAPRPARERWQPLRSGLLNLFRFDHEEFHYEDGHLLLRGNNGTGKSRVLALQLPFLLDGDHSPYRLEPDGDSAKRIEWNLLMGKHADRLGYTWIELGRRTGDDDGSAGGDRFLTLGCGLEAVEGRGLVGKWFFVTEQRVGIDFSLQGSAGEALTRKRLQEVLGDDGEVITAVGEYRRAVDRRLFGLGEARYEALLRLLIQLRQPQLARKLDEDLLSRALTDALPPLSETILADVAEAFASLETERQAVADLRAAEKGAEAFLDVYRRYAQVLARRRAEVVRTVHSAYEHSMRRLREAESSRDDARKRGAALLLRRERLVTEEERLDVEVRTLEASPEMRDKHALDAARRRADEARRELERADRRLAAAHEEEAASRTRLEEAEADARLRRDAARRAVDDTREAARAAALERRPAAAWTALEEEVDEPSAAGDGAAVADRRRTEEALEALRRELDRRRDGLRHLRRLGEEIARRSDALGSAREDRVRVTAEVDGAVEAHRRAVAASEAAVEEILRTYRAWREGLEVIVVPPIEAHDEAFREWSQELAGPSPLAAAVDAAAERARAVTARHLAHVENRIAVAKEEVGELERTAAELEAGVEVSPPAPHTRDAEARATRAAAGAGAPLWKLCDFVVDVPAATRGAAEAALEAAGLLDAWVTPAGELLADDDHDTVLSVAAGKAEGWPGVGLDRVLRPDPEGPGDPAVVAEILRRIGWGEGEGSVGEGSVWVAESGRFRVGPLHGAWSKDEAQYLGASARRAERRRRLEQLARQIADGQTLLAALRAERDETRRQEATIGSEVASAPDDDAVRDAAAEVGAAQREVTRARERLVAAETRVQERRARLDEATAERDGAALDLGLADRLDALEAVERATDLYLRRWAGLGPILDLQRTAARELEHRRGEAEARRRAAERLDEERAEAARASNRAEAERATLEESLGATVERLLQTLDAARRDREERRREIEAARDEETALRVEEARAEERIEGEGRALGEHEENRERAIARLGDLAGLRLLVLAAPAVDTADAEEWSVTRAVEVARAVEGELRGVDADDAVWERLQGRVHDRFRALTDALLTHGYEPSLTTPSEAIVVRVPFQGRSRDVEAFRQALRVETETRERVLAAREREILENHLLSEVSLHLHDRLRSAEELVGEINAEIQDRPMSTGMKLRFDWRPRADEVEHLREARSLLLTDHRIRSAEENRAVGRFLQGLIQKERESVEGGTWRDALGRALDYRAWHHFAIEQHQDGQWRRLTRRTHGTGSGGEKAIALTVPQFAAAAAHYRTARPDAPRLILLDEAFVGVDADMRAKCMGLLVAFDLDFVMTSEREWGCYPTLPGLAIYQLATHPGIDAVGVTRWVWNGRERVRSAPPAPAREVAARRDESARQTEILATEPV